MPISFSDFLARIGEAGQIASNACSDATEKRILELCDRDDESGKLTPRTVDLAIEPDKRIRVPLLALYSPQSMHLQALTVEFETEIELAEPEPEPRQDVSVTLQTGPSDSTTHVRVKADFHVSKPHEAVEQLRDRLVRDMVATLKQE